MGTSSRSILALAWLALVGGCAASRGELRATSLSLREPGGREVALSALAAEHRLTVLVFWSPGCPCVRRYQARVDELGRRFASEGVQLLAVSSNADDDFAESRREAERRGVRVPLWRDDGGRVASRLGASSTPTVAILDSAGILRFLGWIDNERVPGEVGREPWVEQAIESLLAGRTDFRPRTPRYGCTITKDLGGRTCCSNH